LAPDQRVLLFLGAIRPYKGLERLVEAFRRIPGDELRLVIAGKPWYTMPPGELEAMAQSDQRIILEPRFIPDLDLQRYYKAADVVVLPYTGVLSSGATLLSMSFGCPVIAPAIGCLSEVITSETGSLYDPTDPEGVYKALLHTLSLDLETLGQNAYKRAAQLTWTDVVGKTLRVYGAEQDIEKHMPSPVQDMMH
jgi:glycosyltransferase involved in cell wall biosynthesis